MKRIEAFIASEKTPYVLSVLETLGLQATFYESKGMGKGEKYTVSYGKGSGTQRMAYSSRPSYTTIPWPCKSIFPNRISSLFFIYGVIQKPICSIDKVLLRLTISCILVFSKV